MRVLPVGLELVQRLDAEVGKDRWRQDVFFLALVWAQDVNLKQEENYECQSWKGTWRGPGVKSMHSSYEG